MRDCDLRGGEKMVIGWEEMRRSSWLSILKSKMITSPTIYHLPTSNCSQRIMSQILSWTMINSYSDGGLDETEMRYGKHEIWREGRGKWWWNGMRSYVQLRSSRGELTTYHLPSKSRKTWDNDMTLWDWHDMRIDNRWFSFKIWFGTCWLRWDSFEGDRRGSVSMKTWLEEGSYHL